MSQFHCCYNNNIVTIMPFIFFFILFFSLFLESPVLVAGLENPLVELSSREELINLAGYGEAKLSTVLVTGTLLCEEDSDCLDHENPQLNSRPVSGATVAVSCHPCRKMRESNWVKSTTDEDGDFVIDLPSHLHGIPNLEKICILKVVQLPKTSPCYLAFPGNKEHKGITLLSISDGTRTYTTEMIRLRPKTSQEDCTNAY